MRNMSGIKEPFQFKNPNWKFHCGVWTHCVHNEFRDAIHKNMSLWRVIYVSLFASFELINSEIWHESTFKLACDMLILANFIHKSSSVGK